MSSEHQKLLRHLFDALEGEGEPPRPANDEEKRLRQRWLDALATDREAQAVVDLALADDEPPDPGAETGAETGGSLTAMELTALAAQLRLEPDQREPGLAGAASRDLSPWGAVACRASYVEASAGATVSDPIEPLPSPGCGLEDGDLYIHRLPLSAIPHGLCWLVLTCDGRPRLVLPQLELIGDGWEYRRPLLDAVPESEPGQQFELLYYWPANEQNRELFATAEVRTMLAELPPDSPQRELGEAYLGEAPTG